MIAAHGVVLQGAAPGQTLTWQRWWPSTGSYGPDPVIAGAEPGNWEYICHAPFTNPATGLVDTVPGKTVGTTCNISWGGVEHAIDAFSNDVEVLNASVF